MAKDDLITRKRGEVAALGRLIRDIDRGEADARVVALNHYAKARRVLRELHALEARA